MLKPAPEERVVVWLRANSDDLALSAIVLAELRFFVAKQPDGKKKKYAESVLTAIDAGVGSKFFDFASQDANAYGNLMAKLRKIGKPIGAIDGLIAAQAIVRGYTVATRNVGEFGVTGVKLINPWEA